MAGCLRKWLATGLFSFMSNRHAIHSQTLFGGLSATQLPQKFENNVQHISLPRYHFHTPFEYFHKKIS